VSDLVIFGFQLNEKNLNLKSSLVVFCVLNFRIISSKQPLSFERGMYMQDPTIALKYALKYQDCINHRDQYIIYIYIYNIYI